MLYLLAVPLAVLVIAADLAVGRYLHRSDIRLRAANIARLESELRIGVPLESRIALALDEARGIPRSDPLEGPNVLRLKDKDGNVRLVEWPGPRQ